MVRKAIIVVVLAALVAWACKSLFGSDMKEMMLNSAVERQVDRICVALEQELVSYEELCTLLPPQIPGLQAYYADISEKDGEWYASQNSLYYPTTYCAENVVTLRMLGQEYRCENGNVEKL